MKKKGLIAVLAAAFAVASLNGCKSSQPGSGIEKKATSIISGYPISVAQTYARSWGSVATVVKVNGEYVLAGIPNNHYSTSNKIAAAAALIQSEISDGDKEKLELIGNYEEDRFVIKSIKANGHRINF